MNKNKSVISINHKAPYKAWDTFFVDTPFILTFPKKKNNTNEITETINIICKNKINTLYHLSATIGNQNILLCYTALKYIS